jgi:hypothetical protein
MRAKSAPVWYPEISGTGLLVMHTEGVEFCTVIHCQKQTEIIYAKTIRLWIILPFRSLWSKILLDLGITVKDSAIRKHYSQMLVLRRTEKPRKMNR